MMLIFNMAGRCDGTKWSGNGSEGGDAEPLSENELMVLKELWFRYKRSGQRHGLGRGGRRARADESVVDMVFRTISREGGFEWCARRAWVFQGVGARVGGRGSLAS
jgi:hypothetical protein